MGLAIFEPEDKGGGGDVGGILLKHYESLLVFDATLSIVYGIHSLEKAPPSLVGGDGWEGSRHSRRGSAGPLFLHLLGLLGSNPPLLDQVLNGFV